MTKLEAASAINEVVQDCFKYGEISRFEMVDRVSAIILKLASEEGK